MRLLAAAIMLCVSATAVPGQGLGPDAERYRRIEPDAGDSGSLRQSLRQLAPRLRRPADFGDVYADDERGVYFRKSGSLRAVFPRSVYATIPTGTVYGSVSVPLFPAGTVFEIGEPQPAPSGSVGHVLAPRVDRSVTSASGPSSGDIDSPSTIWSDDSLRGAVVSRLLSKASG
ncbi:MAG: hypothetical protein AAGB51_02040 [Planctomycetota bacterium]